MIRQAGATVARLIGGTAREIAEVGVRDGIHAQGLLQAFPVAHLTLVDHYQAYTEPGYAYSPSMQEGFYVTAFRRFFGQRDRVTFLTRTSEQAAALFPDAFFDFVYIDAGHDYVSVTIDLRRWYPKVKPGGYLGGHDYDAGWPEVIRAVNEFVALHGLVLDAYGDWLVQKP